MDSADKPQSDDSGFWINYLPVMPRLVRGIQGRVPRLRRWRGGEAQQDPKAGLGIVQDQVRVVQPRGRGALAQAQSAAGMAAVQPREA